MKTIYEFQKAIEQACAGSGLEVDGNVTLTSLLAIAQSVGDQVGADVPTCLAIALVSRCGVDRAIAQLRELDAAIRFAARWPASSKTAGG